MKTETTFSDGHSHIAFVDRTVVDGEVFWFGYTTDVVLEDGTVVKGHVHSFNKWDKDIEGNTDSSQEVSPVSGNTHNHEFIF